MPLLGITYYPIYGLTVGINYIDDTLQQNDYIDNKERHALQFLLLFFGFNIFWFTDIEQK